MTSLLFLTTNELTGVHIPHFDPSSRKVLSKQTRGLDCEDFAWEVRKKIMADRGALKEASPPSCPEDTVEYRIYCEAAGNGLDPRSDEALSQLALECNYSCRQLSSGHVWHFSRFAVRPVPEINGVRKLFMKGLFLSRKMHFFFNLHLSSLQVCKAHDCLPSSVTSCHTTKLPIISKTDHHTIAVLHKCKCIIVS